jgi:hypothetical protein
MPQLDKVTYASQFFWLSFFFLGFYAFLLKIFLPQINQILKVRMKKLSGSESSLSTIQDENNSIQQKNELLFLRGIRDSKQFFNEASQKTNDWLISSLDTTNKSVFGNLNKNYVQTIGHVSLMQNSILKQLEILLPPTASSIENYGVLIKREKVCSLAILDSLQK